MATVHKKICDRCKKVSEENTSEFGIKGYNLIRIVLSQYNEKCIELCDECMESLGLKEKNSNEIKSIHQENRADTILDLLAGLVQERKI